jgi:N-acetylglucosaminyl-diphospho-decaprenol L-rhamnosyltransferase
MTVSIVIVSFNARADLERCLGSLEAAPPAVPHEVVVIDNASTDGAPAMIASRFPWVRLVTPGRNLGFAAANNVGLRQATGRLVLLLNPDTVVPAGAIDRLCARLDARPDAAALGPRLVDGRGRAELSWGRLPGPFAEGWQKLVGWLHERGVPPFSRLVERRARRERAVDWVSGACLLVRRTDAEAAGLFDERFFLYWEDADFCAALRALGRRVLFSPVAEVTHARGRSGTGRGAAVAAHYRRGQLAFYAKHHPAWTGLLRRYLGLTGRLPAPSDTL